MEENKKNDNINLKVASNWMMRMYKIHNSSFAALFVQSHSHVPFTESQPLSPEYVIISPNKKVSQWHPADIGWWSQQSSNNAYMLRSGIRISKPFGRSDWRWWLRRRQQRRMSNREEWYLYKHIRKQFNSIYNGANRDLAQAHIA